MRDSLEDYDLSEVCNILDKIKSKEPDDEIKVELGKIASEKGCDEIFIETIKNYGDNILLLAMQIIKKLLKQA